MIRIDPRSSILWVRVQGLDAWRVVVLAEIRPRTPMEPEPKVIEVLSLHAESNNKILPLVLTLDADHRHLMSVGLRVTGGFAPDGNDAPMRVEFFRPKDAHGMQLPAPIATVVLRPDDDLVSFEDLEIEEAT